MPAVPYGHPRRHNGMVPRTQPQSADIRSPLAQASTAALISAHAPEPHHADSPRNGQTAARKGTTIRAG